MAMAASHSGHAVDPPKFEDVPYEHTWFAWRGPLSQATAADGSWRSYRHLQHYEVFAQHMLPRVQEFQELLQQHGVRPDTLECGICRQAGLIGRQLTACFAQDVAAGGGRHHLKKLWSVALSVGPGLWEEARVVGGAIRYNYVDGVVELCRGEPPRPGEMPAASSSPSRASQERRRRSSRRSSSESPRPHFASGNGLAEAAAAAGLVFAPQRSVDSLPPPGRACLGGLEDLVAELEDAAGWDSELEDRVVLTEGPIGIEVGPVADGRGAIVQESRGHAAAAGVEVGSTILAINDSSVEDMPTKDIQGMLDKEKLPMTLDLKPPLNLPSVGKRKKRRRDPIVVCTQNCRGSYRVVTDAIEQLGWTEAATDLDEKAPSVVWLEHSDTMDGIAPVQTVSRIEAFLSFCKKSRLAQSLNTWIHELPEEFAFSPKTWVLPFDITELKAAMSKAREEKATFIAKPTAGAQGKGIVLAKKWKDLEAIARRCEESLARPTPTEYAVQQYVNEPLLIDGLKFDMRLFSVVTSVVPLRAYLFKEGLARFCTVPYEPPNDVNLRCACMHLTNFALNKRSADFQTSEGLSHHDEGSKRSVSAALCQIEESYGVSPDVIWDKISKLVANTLVALRPGLVEYYVHERQRPLHPLGPKTFQIIGIDIIIDSNFEPRLLELNANPSLSATQPVPVAATEDQLPEIVSANVTKAGSEPWPPMSSSSSISLLGGAPAVLAGIGTDAPSYLRESRPVAGNSTRPRSTSGNASASSSGPAAGGMRTPSERRRLTSGGRPKSLSSNSVAGPSSPALPRPRSGMLPLASPPRNSTFGRSQTMSGSASAPRLPRGSGSPSASSRKSGTHGSARRVKAMQRSRSRLSNGEPPPPDPGMVVSELDLEIKRELVSQALLLAKPAPRNKTTRLKKQWQQKESTNFIPLDDNGTWTLPGKPSRAEATRQDAPGRCPALSELDFEELAAPRALQYAQAHLQLYRWWLKSCGQGKNTLGQEKVMRLLERKGFVGSAAGTLFPDRVSGQLWLSKVWRDMTDGNFGLNVPQFIELAGRIGRMLSGLDADDVNGLSHVAGVLEYMARGLCSE